MCQLVFSYLLSSKLLSPKSKLCNIKNKILAVVLKINFSIVTVIDSQKFECDEEHQKFLCDNKRCIWNFFQCDGEDDCKDKSDERACGRFLINVNLYQ